MSYDLTPTIRRNLEQARGELTETKLEEMTGISQSTISKIERGKQYKISQRQLDLWAAATKVSVDWLLGKTHEGGPQSSSNASLKTEATELSMEPSRATKSPTQENNKAEPYLIEPMSDAARISIKDRIESDLKKQGWRLDRMEKGDGCTCPQFNLLLVTNTPSIPLRPIDEPWFAHDHYDDDLKSFADLRARKKAAQADDEYTNDLKIRLASDFVANPQNGAVIQQTDYLSSLMTDQLAWHRVFSEELSKKDKLSPKKIIWHETKAFYEENPSSPNSSGFKGLGEALISNQMGASTLAFTDDGHLLLVLQSVKNLQSAKMLAPSGSGSLDWSDKASSQANDLLSLISFGAQRELEEECALGTDGGSRPKIDSKVMVTGFARMLHRAGKPEFFCFGRIFATARKVYERKPERYVDYVFAAAVEVANLKAVRPRDEVRRVCRAYLDQFLSRKDRYPLSYPLEHGLKLLIELCENESAGDALDRFIRQSFGDRHQ